MKMIYRRNFSAVLCGLMGVFVGTCLAEAENKTLPVITPRSYFGYRLGDEGGASTKSSLERQGTIGPRGERSLTMDAKGLPAGLDSLTIGYSPKTVRLCCITALKNYDPRVTDTEMIADLESLYGLVKDAFTNEVVKCEDFDLHNPTKALYASVDNSNISLEICASRRSDAVCNWIEFDVADKRLIDLADCECRAMLEEGKDLFREREREGVCSMLFGFCFLACLTFVVAVPLLVLVLIVQGMICLIGHRHMVVALSWPDVLSVLLAPVVWACMQPLGETKSLSNLIELPIIGTGWGLCFAVRTFIMMRHHPLTRRIGSWITFAIMITTATFMGLFFPTLPE